MRQGHGDHKRHLIRCGCRKIEEVMKLKLMMEDLMECMGWIKYLIKCFGGWYPWMRMWGDEKGRKKNERKRGEGGIYTLGR